MPKLLPFPARRMRSLAEQLIVLSASRERLSRPVKWADRPAPPEPLGNMLQRLALLRPSTVLLLENIVADMLEKAERSSGLPLVIALLWP